MNQRTNGPKVWKAQWVVKYGRGVVRAGGKWVEASAAVLEGGSSARNRIASCWGRIKRKAEKEYYLNKGGRVRIPG